MAESNYAENICQAITIVAEELLKSVTFDRTVLGIIVDDSEKENGKYRVSYNATTFDAYTADTNLKTGANVYVQIPNGDWKEQKLILSKKVDTTTEDRVVYYDPFDSFIDITNNLIKKDLGQKALIANGPTSAISIWNEENMEHAAYTRLGIQASFKSWLKNFDTIKGNYGLVLTISGIMDNTEEVVSRSCILDCNDMVGNPYHFESYYDQKKVFVIDGIKKITSMNLQFFQSDNFYNSQNELIAHNVPVNLFVKDIIISLGYDSSQFENDTLMLYTLDNSSYAAIADLEQQHLNNKNLQVRWIHKFDNGKIQVVDETDKLTYDLYWYRKQIGEQSDSQYSGVDWKRFATQHQKLNEDNTVSITYENTTNYNRAEFVPDVTLQNEYVKAIIMYDGLPIYSNIVEFNNANIVPNKTTEQILNALTITCEDGSYGNYFLYNLGGSIVDQADAQKEREFTLRFNPKPGNAPLIEAETIEWLIPKSGTMIVLNESAVAEDDGYYHILYDGLLGKEDISAERTVKYKIRGIYNQTFNNNTIICRVIKDTLEYTATKELSFGPIGTAGTDYTFVLDFQDRNTALTIGDNEAVLVEAKLYDYKGFQIDKDKMEKCIYSYNILHYPNDQSAYAYCLATDVAEVFELKLINGLTTVPKDNFDILEVTLMGWGDQPLKAYLPIPIRSEKGYYISGPSSVVYNSLGTLDNVSFFQNPYRIFKYGENTYIDSKWEIGGGNSYSAKLYNANDQYILTPLSFYVEDAQANRICVVGSINDTVVWSQPLYITQNKYPSTLINHWNGELSIDEKNNAILAAKVVAGKKNSDNTFSGVMMGDWSGPEIIYELIEDPDDPTLQIKKPKIENGATETIMANNTGIYGFYHGAAAFGFKDDGTAFIGQDGKGRLQFDGNKSTIESNAFATGLGGLSLDFDAGRVLIKNPIKIKEHEINTLKIDMNVEDETTPLKIGKTTSPKFKVDWDGTIYAVNGEFEGKVEATSGKIGAWNLIAMNDEGDNKGALYSSLCTFDDEGKLLTGTYLDASGAIRVGANFSVDYSGRMTALEGKFTGAIKGSSFNNNNGTFSVSVDGALIAQNANITGTITSEDGTIGGWTIGKTTLTGGGVTLNSSDGSVTGASIYAGSLNSNSATNRITLNGYLEVEGGGILGYMESGWDDDTTSSGIGFSHAVSQVKATSLNAGLKYTDNHYVSASKAGVELGAIRADGTQNQIQINTSNINIKGGTVQITGTKLECTIPPTAQSGIYACFA